MQAYTGSAAVLGFVIVFGAQIAAFAQTDETHRGISVSGTAEISAAPDIARVTLGVRTRANRADRAAEENAAAMRKVIQALRQLDIAETDIQTVVYTLQPVFEYPRDAPPRITGYEATNLVEVTVRDLGKVGRVIDAAVTAGANVVQDVAFGLKDESPVKQRSLTEAIADARAKAAVMARALEVRLGPLQSATESSAPIVSPLFARAEAAAETPISPRQIKVRATVNVVYAILQ
ncbi:MAG: SIMPL domain-containing protein [Armatimonadetes bacterium]|nr:SIMPL domain-containing protein [Armatimonadota bacterium]